MIKQLLWRKELSLKQFLPSLPCLREFVASYSMNGITKYQMAQTEGYSCISQLCY